MIDAIVLAGARNTGPLLQVSDATNEAAVSIMGQPMLNYVVDGLLDSQHVGRVIVVGSNELLQLPLFATYGDRVQHLPSGDTMVDNLLRGLDAAAGQRRVLIATSDIPLLTGRSIDDFLQRCSRVTADVFYPIVSKQVMDRHYPGVTRTYVKLKEGMFTGGNLVLVEPQAFSSTRHVVEQAYSARKKPMKLARLLGFRVIVKFGVRRLSLGEIEKRAEKILGYRGAAIITPYPEIGIDVDKPDDITIVERTLRERKEDSSADKPTP